MYYVRIVFFLEDNYDLEIEGDNEIELFRENNSICKIKVDRRFEKYKVIITYGSFTSESEAKDKGEKLLYSVKTQFIKEGIPINISGGQGLLDSSNTSSMNGGLTTYGKENIHLLFPQLTGCKVENEVMGLHIYNLDTDISQVKFVSQDIKIKIRTKLPILSDKYLMNPKLIVPYSLLNSSNVINDIRASFLLKISAIESIAAENQSRDIKYCKVIDIINKKFLKFDLIKNEVSINEKELKNILTQIKNSIGATKNKTIGEKCRQLIINCNLQNKYSEMNSIEFFNRCYYIRSNFVHSGSYDLSELSNYIHSLNQLVLDIFEWYEQNQ